MNLNHLHLLLNHVPVLGTAFGLGLLVLGLWRKSGELKRTALGVFVLAALVAVPVYLTGEPAEDGVKGLPGVSDPIMEQHEKAATVALIGVALLGVAALIGLVIFRGQIDLPVRFVWLLLVVALAVSSVMAWTANLGGQIRHTEIRASTSLTNPASKSDRD